jgi:hypothetical protein
VLALTELGEIALRHGHSKKRNNAIVAALSGALPAALLSFHFPANFPFTWKHWLLSVAIGLLWGNGFEYAYHRWLLHRPRCQFAKGHLEHHMHVSTPDEAEHVSLGRVASPYRSPLRQQRNSIDRTGFSVRFRDQPWHFRWLGCIPRDCGRNPLADPSAGLVATRPSLRATLSHGAP